jgi:DNA-directed RNA polymerase subunit alpha
MILDEEQIRNNKVLEHILQVPMTDFELSARSRNCLERAGIRNLGDLTNVTEEQLLSGKNFGETSLREIKIILETHGLQLGQNLLPARQQPAYRVEDLSPEERAMHEAMVTDLDLSVRARKCLARLQITTIGDLISRSADDLLGVRNFGVTSLNEIREKLGDKALKLRGD